MKFIGQLALYALALLALIGLAYASGFRALCIVLAIALLRADRKHMVRTVVAYAFIIGTGGFVDYAIQEGISDAVSAVMQVGELLLVTVTAVFLVLVRLAVENLIRSRSGTRTGQPK